MKKIFIQLMIIVSFTLTSTFLPAQDPPPPPSDHGGSGNAPADNGAPISGGLFILLGLGAAYGGKKLYDLRKESIEE
ncbi:MAG: hypothetical protein CVT99_03385 [Bacteroidetes bacterium HGW-Bacteroidetes-16]|jgi:hypothetical protein|nr:MAG: hypothetical protein CVT99_03385 [Bacteroidetes bacterium HGW-Bacteroidetes-16]